MTKSLIYGNTLKAGKFRLLSARSEVQFLSGTPFYRAFTAHRPPGLRYTHSHYGMGTTNCNRRLHQSAVPVRHYASLAMVKECFS